MTVWPSAAKEWCSIRAWEHLSDGEDEHQVEKQFGEGDAVGHLARGRPQQLGGKTRKAHRRCPFREQRSPRRCRFPLGSRCSQPPHTPCTAKSASNSTASAAKPAASCPRSSSRPMARAGVSVRAWTATSTGRPTEVTASRNAASRVSVEPAMEPLSASRATPSVTRHLQGAEHVLPVGGTGRRHRIRDQRDPARGTLERQPHDRRMHVHAVVDELQVTAGSPSRPPPDRGRGGGCPASH